MKNLIATTALALVMGAGFPAVTSYADSHSAMMKTYQQEQKGDFYAADFIGKEIYTSEVEWDENYVARSGWEKDWDNIGQVENVILNQDGKVKAVILEVGGFLDIGDKHVAVQMDQLSFIRSEDAWDNYFLAVRTSKDQLMAEPAFEKLSSEARADLYRPAAATTAAATTTDTPSAIVLVAPAVKVDGYSPVAMEEIEQLTAEKLDGVDVYGVSGEEIGEVEKIILSDDGKKVKSLVLEIGGFLGMGDHDVSVPMEQLTVMREDGGDGFRIYADATKEQLEALPEYD